MSHDASMEAFMNVSKPMQNSRELTMASCQRFGSMDVQVIRLLPA